MELRVVTLAISLGLVAHLGVAQPSAPKPVYFSLIVSYGEFGFDSSGGIPSVDIALNYINRSQILPGYQLMYEKPRNSKCTRTDSLEAFFEDFVSSSIPKIALIGCGCSVATEPVAEISHYWNISQISYAAALSSLSDRSRFKSYFRTTPTFNNYAPAIVALLNKFNWKRMAIITQAENLFKKVYSDLRELLQNLEAGTSEKCCFDNYNITTEYVEFETTGDAVTAALDIFEKKEYHVIFVNSYSMHARKLICEAAQRNLVYPHYAWIVYAWYPEGWWREEMANETLEGCPDEVLEDFLIQSRAHMIHILPEPDDIDSITDAGISARDFIRLYGHELNRTTLDPTTTYGIAFDTVWTIAKALNKTEEMTLSDNYTKSYLVNVTGCINMTGDLVPLDEFNYTNQFMGCVIRYNFHQTAFLGVSGPVAYGDDGTIIYNKIRLTQVRLNKEGMLQRVRYGYVDSASNYTLTYEGDTESDDILYPDGIPPDGTPIQIIHSYKVGLTATYYTLALAGVTLAIVCMAFNFIFREKKVIRLTSPKLNYLVIGGSVLMFLSVFIELLPTTQEAVYHSLCAIHVWLYCIGYLVVYGTILAKMWRVYHIFHNPTPDKMILKTWHLCSFVLCITCIGVVLVTVRTVAQALTNPRLVSDSENPEGSTSFDVKEVYSVWRCYEVGSPPFYCDLLIFIYLALLQIVGIVLAFQTRKVKIRVLNDSKFVAALVYISSIVLVIIVLITFILRSYINISAAIFSGGVMILATVFLVLMFVPKMVNLYKDPKGEKVFEKTNPSTVNDRTSSSGTQHSSIAMGLTELTEGERVSLLETRLNALEKEMQVKNQRISELENYINC